VDGNGVEQRPPPRCRQDDRGLDISAFRSAAAREDEKIYLRVGKGSATPTTSGRGSTAGDRASRRAAGDRAEIEKLAAASPTAPARCTGLRR
jgi:hypothetical protein